MTQTLALDPSNLGSGITRHNEHEVELSVTQMVIRRIWRNVVFGIFLFQNSNVAPQDLRQVHGGLKKTSVPEIVNGQNQRMWHNLTVCIEVFAGARGAMNLEVQVLCARMAR